MATKVNQNYVKAWHLRSHGLMELHHSCEALSCSQSALSLALESAEQESLWKDCAEQVEEQTIYLVISKFNLDQSNLKNYSNVFRVVQTISSGRENEVELKDGLTAWLTTIFVGKAVVPNNEQNEQIKKEISLQMSFRKLLKPLLEWLAPKCLSFKEYEISISTHLLLLYSYRVSSENANPDNYTCILINLANSFYMNGNMKFAKGWLEKASICNPSENSASSTIQDYFGIFYHAEGQYTKAIESYNRALKIGEKFNVLTEILKIYGNRAITWRALGRMSDALSDEENSVDLCRKLGENEGLSLHLGNMALCLCNLKKYESAITALDESIHVNPSKHNLGIQYMAKGMIYRDQSLKEIDRDKKVELLRKSIEFLEKSYEYSNYMHPKILANCYRYYANSTYNLGDLNIAELYFGKALATIRTIVEPEMEAFILVENAILLIAKMNLDGADALLIDALKLFDTIRISLQKDDKLLLTWSDIYGPSFCEKLRIWIQIWNKDDLRALELAESFRARSLKASLSDRLLKSKNNNKELNAHDMQLVATKLKIVYFAELIKKFIVFWIIPIGSAGHIRMVNYHRYSDCRNDSSDLATLPTDLSNRTNILETIRSFKIIYNDGQSSDNDLLNRGQEMWEFIEPILRKDECKNIIIIPDGEVATVPFCQLLCSDGTFVLDNYSISYSPSMGSLVMKEKEESTLQKQHSQAIIIGCSDFHGNQQSLENTILECDQIEVLFNKSGSIKTLKYTGTNATKEHIFAAHANSTIFHIATHGAHSLELEDVYPGGLILSSASKFDSCSSHSVLTPADIQNLDLSSLEVAFLNCCFSGAGRVYHEGLVGLGRALLFSGAKYAVLSFRTIPDSDCVVKMAELFYEGYISGLSPLKALQQAQLSLKEQNVPSSTWGAYYILQ